MTYNWLPDLDQALAAAGIPFVEVGPSPADATASDDWRTRGRPASTGNFDTRGVLCHHTASPEGTSTQSDLNVILAGNSSAPGPIAQLFIARDAQLYVVAAGRANHGGSGNRPGIDFGCQDMNAALVGIEVANSGIGERWPGDQTEVYAATVAALCAWYSWPVEWVYLHATTGPPSGGCNSKIDPAGPWAQEPDLVGSMSWDLDVWRSYVATFLGADHHPPIPPVPEEEDLPNRIGPLFIQATGTDGTPPGVVYLTDGRGIALRRIEDEGQLNDVRWQLDQAGYPHDAVHAPPVPVDRVNSYGIVANP